MIRAYGSAETPVGPYANEYIWVLTFDASGDKVLKILEFVDSAFSARFGSELRKHREKDASTGPN